MLTKGQLLNRMEIIFPFDNRLSDLRRAYIDRDINSIYKLMTEYHGDSSNEIRKLHMENNLHVLFRLFDGELVLDLEPRASAWIEPGDLRKFLLEDNIWSLYRILLDLQDTQIVRAIKSLHASGTRWDKDALSQGQLHSKMWLIGELENLNLDLGTVFICAGWYGLLATLMFEHDLKIDCVRSFDIDPAVVSIADKFNHPWLIDKWKFKAVIDDIHNINFEEHSWSAWSNTNSCIASLTDRPDTVINTSCEHIANFDEWYAKIPQGKLVVLQSNDYLDVAEHVNTHVTLADFAAHTALETELFSGVLALPQYNRFMRIGYR